MSYTQLNNNKNYTYSDDNLYLSEAIEKISNLVLLNQVFEAKKLCGKVIEEIKQNRKLNEKVIDILKK